MKSNGDATISLKLSEISASDWFHLVYVILFIYFYQIRIGHHMLLCHILRFWSQNNLILNCFIGLDIMVEGKKHGVLSLFDGACMSFWRGLLQQHWLRGLMHPVQFLFSVLKMTSSPYVGAHQRQRQLACMLYPLLMKLPVSANLGTAKRSIPYFLFGVSLSDCTWENLPIVDLTSSWSHIVGYRRIHNIVD